MLLIQNVPGMKHGGEITVGLERVVHLKAHDVIITNAFHYVHFAVGQSKKISWYWLQQKISNAFTFLGFAALQF
jgi:hypothetical protein